MTQRLLVISDLHLTPPGAFDAFRAGEALAAFVQASARSDTTLVLAGDVLDLLQLPNRPPTLDLRAAPGLIRTALDGIGAAPWGRALFQGLRALIEAGGRCVVLPGNHDPELHHPDTRAILLGTLGLEDDAGLEVHRDPSPWLTQVGQWTVLLGHGHRSDAWNDVDPGALQRALEEGEGSVPLPPGSRLVVQVLQPFKKDERTGAERFAFVDLLKPELAVVLLLLYLDPARALALLPDALGLHAEQILRVFRQHLGPRPTLAPSPAPAREPALADALAAAIAAEVDEDLRKAPDAAVRRLQTWLAGYPAAAAGTLAQHGGARRWIGRAALRGLSQDGSFFAPEGANDVDRAVTSEHLPEGSGPRVVICGHTHAAREHRPAEDRVYINTGTWIDLMRLPELDDDKLWKAWIDELEQDRIERFSKPTYAEVTADGAFLREWTGSGG
jgi:UDP-2,3-diacylglucosamine pyrophosphatase LpxH